MLMFIGFGLMKYSEKKLDGFEQNGKCYYLLTLCETYSFLYFCIILNNKHRVLQILCSPKNPVT